MRKGNKIMRYAKFTKPLTIALSPEVYNVLKEISDADRVSMAECVREILSEMVAPYLDMDENQSKSKANREEKRDEKAR
jgi:hypothetical protein